MINNNNICIFDIESSGLDPRTDEITQIACLMIEPRSLEIIPNSEFNSLMRPVDIMSGTPKEVEDKWFKASAAMRVTGQSRKVLESAPMPEVVWRAFGSHLARYNSGGTSAWARPIAAGHNIQGFDLFFVQRYCEKYNMLGADGKPKFFNPRTVLDTLNLCFYWFENMVEPEKFNMDLLRDYFGMNKENSHEALKDCKDSADLLIRFMKLHRDYSKKVKFKGSFSNK